MHRLFKLSLLSLLLLLPAWSEPAEAHHRTPYSMEILVDGRPLHQYWTKGKTYIEALEGREYSIRLRNRTGERIAVALSVDGLNTIDAKTTSSRKAAKWILGPWQTVTLDGWQTGRSTARRFFFTSEEKSYGAWLGKTKNLGIITAAVFRERHPEPAPIYRKEAGERSRKSGRLGADAPAAPQSRATGMSEREAQSAEGLSDELAATGIGRELDHRVRRVRFDTESSPAAVYEVRYEYHDALVRLGVLPRPHAHFEDRLNRREGAQGFEDLDFAPDPFR